MRGFRARLVATIALLGLAIGLPAGEALGQMGNELVGAWTLVSVMVEQSGNKLEPFGPTPKGFMTFDGNGRFSITIVRGGLPKFASSNREAGTPDENRAVVQGSIAYFGTYSVNDRVINVHIEGSTFPNWEGADQKRLFAVSGDELRIINPTPSIGWGTAQVIWKRAK
jgi:hypothetical protein